MKSNRPKYLLISLTLENFRSSLLSSVSLSGVGKEIMGAKQTIPCGAFADVKELEYISALHQTGKIGLRKDGSINGA